MVLGALYVMQRRLLEPLDEMDLTDVSHAGGAGLVEPSGNGEPPSAHSAALRDERPTSPTQLLEVIEWPIADRAVARFAFDSESFLIVRITVRDLLLGAEATIDVGDHQNIGGLIWPCAIEVRGSGYDYCETWSDWEFLP
jgi:hypothetical protein